MTFSKLIAGTIKNGGMYSPRIHKVTGMIMHHAASTNFAVVKRMMESASHELSANYLIANDGKIYGCVPEEYRAWTSGSPNDGGKGADWDHRSITFECINESGDPDWKISAAAQESIARLLADVATRYGFTPKRGKTGNVFGHRELWQYFEASYPTACPGGMPVTVITNRAKAIMAGGKTGGKVTMKSYTPKGTNAKNARQQLPADGVFRAVQISDANAKGTRSVSIAKGKDVTVAASVYMHGTDGTTPELAFLIATYKNGKKVSQRRVWTASQPAIIDTIVKATISAPITLAADERLRIGVMIRKGQKPAYVSRVGWSVR